MDDGGLRATVIAEARRLGFHRVAVVPVEAPRRMAQYAAWIAAGRHGDMAYLASPEHVAARGDLGAVLSGARTLVVVALAYERRLPAPPPGADPSLVTLRGRIARYARGEDYHMVLRDKLVALADAIASRLGRPVAARPCVDSAPLLEREWAERGGLGFVAKNTMVIAPGLGSYILLGELLLDLDLEPTAEANAVGAAADAVAAAAADAMPAAARPRCGTCRRCLDACPTGAFTDAYVLDARRCISYLTIELTGAIPRDLRPLVGTWIFGCDICQEVCPFNAGGAREAAPELAPRDLEHATPDLVALAFRNTNQLRQFVKRTALRRVGRVQLQRNVAVALGNTGDAAAVPAVRHLLASASPLVRAHAAWALGRLAAAGALADDDARATLDAALLAEADDDARAEIAAARPAG